MDGNDGDAALVRAAQGGDKDAFAALVVRHRPLLRALCTRALGDPWLVEDAVQEASLQALLNLERLRQPERFGAWLAGIGLNVCRRWLRQRGRDHWSLDALRGGVFRDEPVDAQPGPEALVELAELHDQVHRVVMSLPPGQRAAVRLHYLEGLTQAEAAALLGVERGAIKTRLHKARNALRRELSADAKEDEVSQDTAGAMVEMRVRDVRRRTVGDEARHHVVLEEAGGERRLPIWMGEFEASAIALHLEQIAVPRPMTYAFTASLLEAVGGRVHEARIERLADEVFYATVAVEGPTGSREVDARPSDAINLALLAGAPIRVNEDVLEMGAKGRPQDAQDLADAEAESSATIAASITTRWAPTGGESPEEQ